MNTVTAIFETAVFRFKFTVSDPALVSHVTENLECTGRRVGSGDGDMGSRRSCALLSFADGGSLRDKHGAKSGFLEDIS